MRACRICGSARAGLGPDAACRRCGVRPWVDPTPRRPSGTDPDWAARSAHRGETVGGGHPCLRCGYDLAGLQVEWNCPECGVPVWDSIRPRPDIFHRARAEAQRARNWGIASVAFLFICLGPIAMLMAPAAISGADRALSRHPAPPSDIRTTALVAKVLGWVTVGIGLVMISSLFIGWLVP